MSDAIVLPVTITNSLINHPHDLFFVEGIIESLPYRLQKSVQNTCSHIYEAQGRQAANLWLIGVREHVKGKQIAIHDDEAIKHNSIMLAGRMKPLSFKAASIEIVRHGLSVPESCSKAGALARMRDPVWLQHQFRQKQDREQEALAVQLGFIHRGYQPYCSTALLKRIRARQERAKTIMQGREAVSDEGDTLNMWEVLEGSVANPAVRRAELMTRMRGMEDYSIQAGHVAMFYTITCPSKLHRYSGKSLNPKYNGSTPKEAQKYLTGLWGRIRAKLKRDELNTYGFRVAEPHHDGTPHWHMLLFMEKGHCHYVTEIIRHYAMKEDGAEAGAAKHRFESVSITPEKGSATGYIAKYISKNIDAFGMDDKTDDETGKPASDSAQRVRAWASVWGIRQFQQIGGAPVGVWRELRRLFGDAERLATLEGIALDMYEAATGGDWCKYLELQGGADTDRKTQPVRTYSTERIDTDTGEISTNRYGETVSRVKGLALDDVPFIETRTKVWTVREKQPLADDSKTPIVFDVATCAGQDVLSGVIESTKRNDYLVDFLQDSNASAFPWSSINNCTGRGAEALRE